MSHFLSSFLPCVLYSLSPVVLCTEAAGTHACDGCGRVYKYKRSLARHQRYECGTEQQFPCPMCPYRAKQKCHLVTHTVLRHYSDVSKI
ncbi:hypothetical protein J6590_014853 [Homalodisca vitripennis]|nr:hypothetical protein J6590_014853 [Homalodisca vitripennis]